MTPTTRALLAALAATAVAGCSQAPPPAPAFDFAAFSDNFTHGALALSPVSATQAGYHDHNGASLDEAIDDYSAAGLEAQRKFFQGIRDRVGAVNAATLDKEQQADVQIISNAVGLSLLELDTIQSYRHNPTVYVELVGNALYVPYVLNYAPLDKRFSHIVKRLEEVPAVFEQAMANLLDAPDVWNRVAREENDGNIALVDKTLRAAAPAGLKAAYDAAADKAIAAARDFNAYLAGPLSNKTSDWRLGKDKYAQKFKFALAIDKTPDELLADAEAALKETRDEMAKLAAPQTVKQALGAIAQQHATPETYMAEAKKTLEQATAFVRDKGLMTLPTRSNLEVIETPEFMRGIYGVGGFNPAPALQPELGAFYWVTPIPKTWPKARIESKLREYNTFGMQQLTIHEAMPGHYVQFEYANDVQPISRRLLRNVFGSGTYIEGWAFYTQLLMSDQGYLNNSTPLRMTMLKQMLRGISNTILDIRLQTMGMTDQQAMDLMIGDTFQEREEATAKLQRAQLSSCQLPTYFAGLKAWQEARDKYKQARGPAFSLREFHERSLKEGPVPLGLLSGLIQQ
jgi:uncharacterized protein (DUF885 family)